MEELFKKRLQIYQAQPAEKTFAEAILGDVNWSNLLDESPSFIPTNHPGVTEKSMVIESFTQYAKEKILEQDDRTLSFSGGEIGLKTTSLDLWKTTGSDFEHFKNDFAKKYAGYPIKWKNQPKIIFVSELLVEPTEKAADLPEELSPFFKQEAGELFLKMILALKISVQDVVVLSTELELLDLLECLYWMDADVVVSMGATATKTLFQTNDKLSQIHGQLKEIKLENKKIKVIPLFHPNILVGNVNMKKTTWIDMQNIIKILHKSPIT